MPGWAFGLAAAAWADRNRKAAAAQRLPDQWESHLREPPALAGRQHRPVVSTRRLAAAEKTKELGLPDYEEQLLLREVFDKYDQDSSQELDRKQLRNLMAALNEGIYPTDAEVDGAMKRCDKSKSGGLDYEEFKKAMTWWYQNTHPADHIFHGANVHEKRMTAAQKAMTSNDTEAGSLEKDEENMLEEIFRKYDADKTGQINCSELAKMMTDVNRGIPPTSDEVTFVLWSNDFGQTGTLNMSEFKQAILYWYAQTHDAPGGDDQALQAVRLASRTSGQNEKGDGKGKDSSGCCCIS